MPSFDRVVVLGAVPDDTLGAVRGIATDRGVLVERWDAGTDIAAVAALVHPLAVLVDTDDPFAVLASLSLRQIPKLVTTPILGFSKKRRREDFLEFLALGGDDLVDAARVHQLGARLDGLLRNLEAKEKKTARGKVVLASAESRWLSLVRVTFERAGYEVNIASDHDSAPAIAMSSMARVVVVGPDLAGDPLLLAKANLSRLGWVLACPQGGSMRRSAAERVKRVDATLPPETLLAATNELLFVENANQRASQRLPFATPISFRISGTGEDDVGFCHNLSAGGFYVRTLSSPQRGEEVWVEMLAPMSDRHVRLMGTVMWNRGYGREDVSAPPGFGVLLKSGLGRDHDVFLASYAELLRESMCDPGPLSERLPETSTA